MKEKLETFFELSFLKRVLILLTVPLVVAVVGWFLFCKDITLELVSTENELSGMKNEIEQRKIIVSKFTKFEEEVSKLEQELTQALYELPDKKEISQLLERIADKAKEAGLDIRLFQPQPEEINDYYAEIPVRLEVSGGYHQTASFFDELTRLNRIININEIGLVEPKTGEKEMVMKSSLVASAYRFLDESERPKSEKSKAKKKKT